MIINEKNRERVENLIREAEGRATTRTISFEDILNDIKVIERTLGITKKRMTGIRVEVDHHAQNFPRAYKYRAESTQYVICRKANGWDLVSAERLYTHREGHAYKVELTDDAKQAIIERMSDF